MPADKLKVQARMLHTNSTYKLNIQILSRTQHRNEARELSHRQVQGISTNFTCGLFIQTLRTNFTYKYCHELNIQMSHANSTFECEPHTKMRRELLKKNSM